LPAACKFTADPSSGTKPWGWHRTLCGGEKGLKKFEFSNISRVRAHPPGSQKDKTPYFPIAAGE
jgi:hypothetical protein